LKRLLENLSHRGPLKTTSGATCGPRVGQPCPIACTRDDCSRPDERRE